MGRARYLRNDLYLSNYATIQIRDELLRLPGVGDVTFLGQRDYSMRLWLKPEELATRNMTAGDVVSGLKEQNVQVAAGMIGQPPVPPGQDFELTINTLGRLITPAQFGEIILKSEPGGHGQSAKVVRVRDVARTELGAQQYDQSCTLDAEPSVALSIYQLPGSNAIDTAKAVYAKMNELAERFPEGLKYKIVYDTTPFIYESVTEVLKTLRDATILVALVVLVFLQNWRAAIIPLIAVPVAIIGTFAVMAGLGFSLNNLSLFGLVLAIGIVVDDAIVVVENVERWLAEGLAPVEAAMKAMDEVTGPVIAVALVLCAVFVPCALIGGITGQFFRQFALTIAVSTVISALNSLSLSPALAAVLLKPHGGKGDRHLLCKAPEGPFRQKEPVPFSAAEGAFRQREPVPFSAGRDPLTVVMDALLGWFFRLFNRGFQASTGLYVRCVGKLLRGSLIVLVLYAGLLYLTWWGMTHVPTGFIPQQDKGYLLVNAQLPDGASVERTRAVMERIEHIARKIDGVAHTVAISGQSLLLGANASNFGSMYVMLREFHDRKGRQQSGDAIAAKLFDRCQEEVRDGIVSVFGAPPVDGLGNAGGFKLMVEDREAQGLAKLQKAADQFVERGNATAGLDGLFTSLRADTPWIFLDIDRIKAKSMGVAVGDVFDALQMNVGSLYVNNFNQFGRSWQVNVQADAAYRYRLDDVCKLKVRNRVGEMVPLKTMVNHHDDSGPVMVMRYNMYPAAAINGNPAPGTSTGEAIAKMNAIGRDPEVVPPQMACQWTELTFMQIQAGNTATVVFILAVVLVFLVLAAQYESWSLPLAVILVVPMCLLCSVAGVAIARMDVNIFTQIGFVVLVGLASKNAILIVEFARQRHQAGAIGTRPPSTPAGSACDPS